MAETSPVTNPTVDYWWDHSQFTGYDSEILGNEGLINEGGTINISWLVGLSTSQGNAMTEAIARNAVILCETEWGNEGGWGGNETGAQSFGSAQSGGLTVSW